MAARKFSINRRISQKYLYFRYVLMTTHTNQVNIDLVPRFRPLNFLKSPFHLPIPVCLSKDTTESSLSSYMMLADLQSMDI